MMASNRPGIAPWVPLAKTGAARTGMRRKLIIPGFILMTSAGYGAIAEASNCAQLSRRWVEVDRALSEGRGGPAAMMLRANIEAERTMTGCDNQRTKEEEAYRLQKQLEESRRARAQAQHERMMAPIRAEWEQKRKLQEEEERQKRKREQEVLDKKEKERRRLQREEERREFERHRAAQREEIEARNQAMHLALPEGRLQQMLAAADSMDATEALDLGQQCRNHTPSFRGVCLGQLNPERLSSRCFLYAYVTSTAFGDGQRILPETLGPALPEEPWAGAKFVCPGFGELILMSRGWQAVGAQGPLVVEMRSFVCREHDFDPQVLKAQLSERFGKHRGDQETLFYNYAEGRGGPEGARFVEAGVGERQAVLPSVKPHDESHEVWRESGVNPNAGFNCPAGTFPFFFHMAYSQRDQAMLGLISQLETESRREQAGAPEPEDF